MEIRRDTFWNISSDIQICFYILAGVASVIFLYGFYRRYRLWNRGRKEKIEWKNIKENFGCFSQLVIRQTKLKKDRAAGAMHKMIAYGFTALFIGTVLVFVDEDFRIPILQGKFYLVYELVLDVFGLLFIVGLIAFLFIRGGKFRKRMLQSKMDYLFLILFLLIGIGGYITEGIRLSETNIPYAHWSPVGYGLSLLFSGSRLFNGDTYLFWWLTHGLLAFVLIAMIPFTKLLHVFTAPLNILISPVKRSGDFDAVVLMKNDQKDRIAVEHMYDFTNLQLLSTDACTECGRCDHVCPAKLSGKDLAPRNIIMKIRDNMSENRAISSFISSEELKQCTNCSACVEACPVSINHVDLILAMRRGALTEKLLNPHAEEALVHLEQDQNIWGSPWSEREDWMKGLNIPVLRNEEDTSREA
ncbi:(Fe-S)-binding protein [Bacillus norwichensis]|uniref:4Fe-4S dicluster domain-containing protein n=1 Tax=Bacillus norwichensis TaxID=2762217 RepID=A0ABR8VN61_9BACI|nr:(Fe-S)-binding protein [Bacillus norwichensis]MBD8006209.1 4Fe-4S dicluster domain-containing protein [Bacillus norwichensis]